MYELLIMIVHDLEKVNRERWRIVLSALMMEDHER